MFGQASGIKTPSSLQRGHCPMCGTKYSREQRKALKTKGKVVCVECGHRIDKMLMKW